ncbi:MAG: HAMP domain-containing protein [Treponema sp.]|jgi:adenylate cyclase|nr:HAMP domain-containing protein [Treponema sp.]
MEEVQARTRVKFPIGAKLIIIISVLLIVSLSAVIALVSFLSTQDVRRTAEYNNFTINRRSGSHAEGSFQAIHAAVDIFLITTGRLSKNGRDPEAERNFFGYNKNIAAIQDLTGTNSVFIPNENFLLANNISESAVKAYFASANEAAELGRLKLFNASPSFKLSLISAVFLRAENETVKVLFMPDDLSESFGIGTNTSFIVNLEGDVLLHPDNDVVLSGVNFSSLPIFVQMRSEGGLTGRQISYKDGDESFFGAYYPIAGTDSVAITTIPYSVVFEAVRSITFQNIYLTAAVLFAAILFIWFFSKKISGPVRALAGAALQIESGNFETRLEPETKDEIGLLTESFSKMTGALNIFGRFTNRGIALRAMRGEIKPGGLPKHATIFFSDIRGFTEKSENFTKSYGNEAPNKIVAWLNEYFSHMVDCVEKTGGVVDKFIGDAVMAHWGTASTAGSAAADAFNCVKAALIMRAALYKLNKQRQKNDPGNPEIRIGCGINTGIVTAGQLGSEKRMEYTVIGDPVNLASRVEALNKPLGTDILITEDTWNLVHNKFITEEMPPVSVKGKKNPVRIFAVVNIINTEKGPKTLAEVRKLLDIAPPNLGKVDTNAKEKKYKFQAD